MPGGAVTIAGGSYGHRRSPAWQSRVPTGAASPRHAMPDGEDTDLEAQERTEQNEALLEAYYNGDSNLKLALEQSVDFIKEY